MTSTVTTFLAGLEAEEKQCLIQKNTQAFIASATVMSRDYCWSASN
jgi:hypothetical protein